MEQNRNAALWHCIARLRDGKGKAEIRVAGAELGIPSRRQSRDVQRNASEKLRQALQWLGPACRRYAREKRGNAAHRISSDAISKGIDMLFGAAAQICVSARRNCTTQHRLRKAAPLDAGALHRQLCIAVLRHGTGKKGNGKALRGSAKDLRFIFAPDIDVGANTSRRKATNGRRGDGQPAGRQPRRYENRWQWRARGLTLEKAEDLECDKCKIARSAF